MVFDSGGKQQQSSFPLPAELRNKVYGYVFEHEDPIYVAHTGSWRGGQFTLYRRIGDRNVGLFYLRKLLLHFPKKNTLSLPVC